MEKSEKVSDPIEEFDALIARAVLDCMEEAAEMDELLERPDVISLTPSKRALRKIRRISNQYERKRRREHRLAARRLPVNPRVCKKILLVASLLLASLAFLGMAVPQIRDKIHDFFLDWQNQFVGVVYESQAENSATPTNYIREPKQMDLEWDSGVVVDEQSNRPARFSSVYCLNDGQKIYFTQSPISLSTARLYDNQRLASMKEITVYDYPGLVMEYTDGSSCIMWSDSSIQYCVMTYDLSASELLDWLILHEPLK